MKNVSRRELLSTAAGSAALMGLLVGTSTPAQAAPGNGKGNQGFTFEVLPDMTTLDFVREVAMGETFPTGPFYISGSIYRNNSLDPMGNPNPGAQSIGTFREWGWIHDGVTGDAVVNQSFEFSSGQLQVAGSRPSERLGVTGGSQQFFNVRGQGIYTVINAENFSFRVQFKLQGAGGGVK
jgi:hypothetical protein